jgi:hypothetical protein
LLNTVSAGPEGSPTGPAEESEVGYNNILLPNENFDLAGGALVEAASLLGLGVSELENLFAAGQPLPLVHTKTSEAATRVENELKALGLDTVTVAEQDLYHQVPPKKIRAFELRDESLVAAPAGGGGKLSARWEEFVLLVMGRLIMNRVEVEEPKSRRNKQKIERRELSSDEAVFDLYTSARDGGWRIAAASFDFSSLGEAKGSLAVENFVRLAEELRRRSSNLVSDDSYIGMRRILSRVWPIESRKGSQGWRRAGAGKYSLTTATVSDNDAQFTRYSRLLLYLRQRESQSSQ